MDQKQKFLSHVIVLTGHESSAFVKVAQELTRKTKESHPDLKVLYLEGFWTTLGKSNLDLKNALDKDDSLGDFFNEYNVWKKVIDDLKPHYDLIIVCGTWIKHLALQLTLSSDELMINKIKSEISDYPIYFVSQDLNVTLTNIQKKSFQSLCEMSLSGNQWTLVPSNTEHHIVGLHKQIVKNFLQSAI